MEHEIRKILTLTQCSTPQNDQILDALAAFQCSYPEVSMDQLRYESSGDTILHCAARLGNLEITQHLLQYFSPDCRNKDNKTPLHEAAQFGQAPVACALLAAGADVNALKKSDWTPLMLACTKLKKYNDQQHALIKLLLVKGASINFLNKDGWSALHLAAREGDHLLVEILLAQGGRPEIRTKNGNTCLHIAALHNHVQVFKILFLKDPRGAQCLHCQSNQGNYPLHEAVLSKSLETFKNVLEFYLNLELNESNESYENNDLQNLRNKSGYNIMHMAAFIGQDNIVNYCATALNFNINVTTIQEQNCLHLAAMNKMWTTYKLCLALGAVDHQDNFGRTPSDYNKYPQECQCSRPSI